MSRGPGRIEQAIRALLDAHPDLAFVTDELVEHCFPDVTTICRKHQVSVLRAAQKVVTADPDWTAWRIEGQGRGWVFLNHASVKSYTLGQIIRASIYRSEKRATRRVYNWVRKCPGMRQKVLRSHERFVPDRAALLAQLEPGTKPAYWWMTGDAIADGTYAREVAEHIAWRDGDEVARAAITARRKVEEAAWLAGPKAWAAYKRCQATGGGGNETLTEIIPPTGLSRLADHVRALMVQNDPDVLRANLAALAAEIDAANGQAVRT